MKRKPGGHTARTDPATDRLFRTMRATVELVRDLDGRLSDDANVHLRAAALGVMTAYGELTGLPAPIQIIEGTK
ncbi:hypothetical protein [Arthrobacter sp. NPDC058192]|uniref:hypothetical protein n=1 Tax=Arthrobacter sp. NPDC058192 TaxID=3346372 RepID=UPI0036E7FBFB